MVVSYGAPFLRYFPGENPPPYFPCDHSRFHFFSAAETRLRLRQSLLNLSKLKDISMA